MVYLKRREITILLLTKKKPLIILFQSLDSTISKFRTKIQFFIFTSGDKFINLSIYRTQHDFFTI